MNKLKIGDKVRVKGNLTNSTKGTVIQFPPFSYYKEWELIHNNPGRSVLVKTEESVTFKGLIKKHWVNHFENIKEMIFPEAELELLNTSDCTIKIGNWVKNRTTQIVPPFRGTVIDIKSIENPIDFGFSDDAQTLISNLYPNWLNEYMIYVQTDKKVKLVSESLWRGDKNSYEQICASSNTISVPEADLIVLYL